MNDSDFYERIKELAKKKNITVKNLIEACGINYDSYNSCKRYGNLPRADETLNIARALNTTVEFLVTGEETNPLAEKVEKLEKKLESIRKIIDG